MADKSSQIFDCTTGKQQFEAIMTWTEMITINADTSVDKTQVISKFYKMSPIAREKDLADIALLCSQDATNGFCIRLTWQGDIPENGKSSLGARLADVFSKEGRIDHCVWKRETSLFLVGGGRK